MRITITIDEPHAQFQERLLALLAEYAVHVEVDATWTAERAERYYRALPARARRIIAEASRRGGYVTAEVLRDEQDGSLRGHSASLRRTLDKGARKGWWPAGMEMPVEPQGPGFGKVVGYRMAAHLVDVFLSVSRVAPPEIITP
ncbi:hypothetical protein [Streptomyces sp. ODS05-4]|uniref:hypothetical protein n=1 Tax=Streptomyces sp. ODS05-4 TaxID=2944939 RepID=UPI00210E9815|nr:hypothetical protein [Streptomyces sp. ODS05-4]